MRTFFYNVTILLLKNLVPLLAKFNPKINLFYQGRKKLLNKIKSDLANNNKTLFWVHCSSVGEFEQGLPIIELLKKENPSWLTIITFFSPSGYQAINHPIIDYKYYLPYDTPKNASFFLEIVKPKIAMFIKYEYWFHFLNQLHIRGIPTYSISSIFRKKQVFFKWHGSWNRKMLQKFSYFMVQDEPSVKLLHSIGITNTSKTGDTRMDRVLKIRKEPIEFTEITHFIDKRKVFLIGSLRKEDDDIIFSFIKKNQNYAFIIAPHNITNKHINKIELALNTTVRYSNLTKKSKQNVLIIDSMGKLSRLYRLAHFAYIGGGFSDGIHNILEAAVYNIPVFFGNQQYKKYKEAVDLVELKAAFPISNAKELTNILKKLNCDPKKYQKISTITKQYINANKGAAQKIVNIIKQQI